MVAHNPGEVELAAVVAETPKAPSPLRDWLRGGTEELEEDSSWRSMMMAYGCEKARGSDGTSVLRLGECGKGEGGKWRE
jgi:hypothetical protein